MTDAQASHNVLADGGEPATGGKTDDGVIFDSDDWAPELPVPWFIGDEMSHHSFSESYERPDTRTQPWESISTKPVSSRSWGNSSKETREKYSQWYAKSQLSDAAPVPERKHAGMKPSISGEEDFMDKLPSVGMNPALKNSMVLGLRADSSSVTESTVKQNCPHWVKTGQAGSAIGSSRRPGGGPLSSRKGIDKRRLGYSCISKMLSWGLDDSMPDDSQTPSKRKSLKLSRKSVMTKPRRTCVIFGGAVKNNQKMSYCNSVWYLDIAAYEWKKIAIRGDADVSCPGKRTGHSAVVIEDEMFVFGGVGYGGNFFNDLWAFKFSSRQWTNVAVRGGWVPGKRAYHASTTVDGKLLVFGGLEDPTIVKEEDSVDIKRPADPTKLALAGRPRGDLWVLDPTVNEWVSVDDVLNPPARAMHSFVTIEYGSSVNCMVFGGYGRDGELLNDLWSLDPAVLKWQAVQFPADVDKPCPRKGHSAAHVDGCLLVSGGIGENGNALSDLWSFSLVHQQWQLVWSGMPPHELQSVPFNSSLPAARSQACLVNLGVVNGAVETLLMGGVLNSSNPVCDTWVLKCGIGCLPACNRNSMMFPEDEVIDKSVPEWHGPKDFKTKTTRNILNTGSSGPPLPFSRMPQYSPRQTASSIPNTEVVPEVFETTVQESDIPQKSSEIPSVLLDSLSKRMLSNIEGETEKSDDKLSESQIVKDLQNQVAALNEKLELAESLLKVESDKSKEILRLSLEVEELRRSSHVNTSENKVVVESDGVIQSVSKAAEEVEVTVIETENKEEKKKIVVQPSPSIPEKGKSGSNEYDSRLAAQRSEIDNALNRLELDMAEMSEERLRTGPVGTEETKPKQALTLADL